MSDKDLASLLPQDHDSIDVDETPEESNLRGVNLSIQKSVNMESDPTLTDDERKLGPRRFAFVRSFMSNGGDSEDAAKQAGYPASYGSRLLLDKTVKKVILERLQSQGYVQNLTPDWVLSRWAIMHEKCSKEVQEFDRNGKPVGTKIMDASNANRALENIARHLGMFKDTMEVGGGDKPIEIVKQELKINIGAIASGIAKKIIDQKEIKDE